ncbi:hypothetical protein GCM10028775_76450 [Catellatospora paridis]
MSEQKPDDLAAELVPDPTRLPDVVVLRGFLGKSDRVGVSRLYVDLRFSEFVEVADEDVLARRSLDANQNPLGGSVLWVRRNAPLLRATVCLAREHAAFLKGDITAKALHRSRMELPVGRRPAELAIARGGPTDPLYYSTCRGPQCEDPGEPGGCPLNTIQ